MKKNMESGLFLRRRQTPKLSLTGCVLFWGWLLAVHGATGYGDWIAPVTGTAVCLLLLIFRKKQHVLYPVLLVGTLLLALICRRELTEGLYVVWNRAGQLWTAATGKLILTPAVTEAHTAVFSVVFAVVLAVLSCRMAEYCPRLSAVLLALTAVVLAVFLKTDAWVMLALAVLVLVMTEPKAALMRAAVCVVCAAVMAAVCLSMENVQEGTFFDEIRVKTENFLHELRYETEIPQLPEGDFSTPVKEITTQETALRVTMEQPEELFLRGFVGDTFDGERWTAISNETAADSSALLYWLHVDGFRPQTQLSLVMEEPINRVTVENVAACSRYYYIPYNMERLSASMDVRDLQPSELKTDGLRGQRAYSFTTIHSPEELLGEQITRLQSDMENLPYRSQEGSYRAFVLEQDLQLPETGMDSMIAALDACAQVYGGKAHITMEEAEACVLLFLQKYLSEGDLTLPLEDTAKGTVYQTATATVLALRYFDIPARYVEGYAVLAAESGTVEVPASCGTAWAEVYQDGIGWIPLTLTPGFQAISGQVTDSLQSLQGSGLLEGEGDVILPEGKELEQEEEQEEEEEESEEAAERTPLVRLAQTPWLWLLLLLIPVLLILILWTRHRMILKKRLALFAQEDHREALCCLFSDSAKLLEKLGLHRNGGSMLTLPAGMLPAELAAQLSETAKLNNEALFSSHPISKEQRDMAEDFRKNLLEHLKQTSKWHQKAIMQWLQCLY